MADIFRLNGAIRALEQGRPAFTAFSPPEVGMAQAINAAPYFEPAGSRGDAPKNCAPHWGLTQQEYYL